LEKMRNLTVRVDEATFRDIEETAESENIDRSAVARSLLKIGLAETRKRRALDMYRGGKCTLWKAAELAGVPLREMMELAEENRIPLHISPEDVDEAWRLAFDT
jgi:predicted HTH domain antitoxin